jgi:hypothetical protein
MYFKRFSHLRNDNEPGNIKVIIYGVFTIRRKERIALYRFLNKNCTFKSAVKETDFGPETGKKLIKIKS